MRYKLTSLPLGATLAMSFLLAACGGDDNDTPAPPLLVVVPPAAPPLPPPTPPITGRNVQKCLTQEVAPGKSVASLVIPDTLQINLNAPASFPNGRRLEDSVVDITLAALLLDLTKHPATTFLGIPLNPPANDRPFLAAFPFLAPPQGTPPIDSGTGSGFRFRNDLPSAYVRVDRTGFPATSTALISGGQKIAFNDAGPADDVAGKFTQDMINTLTALASQLDDDLRGAGLTPCAF